MPQGPAPDANALTLVEYAKLSNVPLVKAVVMSLYEQGSVLTDIPLKTKKTMNVVGSRFTGKNMPRVDWAKINDLPIGTKAVPERFTESAFLIRNSITTDRYLAEDENALTDLEAFQVKAYLQELTYKFNDYFINNSHDGVGDHDDAIVGLKARLNAPATYGVQAGLVLDAAADISLATLGDATLGKPAANNFLIQLDRLLAALNARDGDGVTLYMNEKASRLGAAALRTLGAGAGWSTTKDAYDRPLEMYKKAVIKDIGRKDDQYSYIINAYETSTGTDATSTGITPATYGTDAGTGKNFTSIYAVRYGEDYLSGWQWEPLKPKNFGLVTPPGTYREILFDWACGLMMQSSRSIARLYDIKLAP
jgi:hypothetical protein